MSKPAKKTETVVLEIELKNGGGTVRTEVSLINVEQEIKRILEYGVTDVLGSYSYFYPGNTIGRINWLTTGVRVEEDEDNGDEYIAELTRGYKGKKGELTLRYK